jgi:hypothetical protein
MGKKQQKQETKQKPKYHTIKTVLIEKLLTQRQNRQLNILTNRTTTLFACT